MLTEELPLYERLTGEEHLLFAARMHGLPEAEGRRRAQELLEFLSLADERGKLVVDYSQGMRKKLALACALVHGPSVLFLDEPLSSRCARISASVPCATMRPRSITATSSHSRSATSSTCVVKKSVTPRAHSRRSRSLTTRPETGSMPLSGSSRNSTEGP